MAGGDTDSHINISERTAGETKLQFEKLEPAVENVNLQLETLKLLEDEAVIADILQLESDKTGVPQGAG